ncbi:MAG: alkaline shock response membrane anchor protein AmaP [Clostridiales bacterium]|nr:alkaline shock response membrane anchor protein AmaP [Clostridiales bacterium]
MNRLMRVLMFIYSVFIAVLSIILLYAFIDDGIFSRILSPLASLVTNPATKFGYLAILLVLLITAILAISNLILTGRLYRTKLRKTDIGSVDIGADAIESIALNSAKSAQAGIKSAKARVTSAKNGAIKVNISAVLYSNVEIPASMSKVQDKVKKDIERYTGIIVESVFVKVSKVEAIVARVEGR